MQLCQHEHPSLEKLSQVGLLPRPIEDSCSRRSWEEKPIRHPQSPTRVSQETGCSILSRMYSGRHKRYLRSLFQPPPGTHTRDNKSQGSVDP